MNKKEYLIELENILIKNEISKENIKNVLLDYSELYDQGLESGQSDEKIISRLGSPIVVYNSLKQELKKKNRYSDIIPGIMVFVSLIIFFVIGYTFKLWHFSWLAFLLIPISALVINIDRSKIVGLSLFISFIAFYILGLGFKLWHPSWLVFLLVPILGIILHTKLKEMIVALSPFITLIIFILVGYFINGSYKYMWTIFLLIPLIGLLEVPITLKNLIGIILLLASTITYLVLGFKYSFIGYPLLVFIIPLVYLVLTGNVININVGRKVNKKVSAIVISIIVLYLIISFAFNAWRFSFLILLFIPMVYIYQEQKLKPLVSYSPFVSTIVFYCVGYFVDGGFAYSWLAFLLIPILGIFAGIDKREERYQKFNVVDQKNEKNEIE